MQRLLCALLILFVALPARAVEPDEILKDPQLEARARSISEGLRCLVCQNQSIDDSAAPLAKDLRVLIRERLQSGDSNEAAVDFVVARYGEYVLLKPRFETKTLLLWLAPFAAVLLGAAFMLRRGRIAAETEPELTDAERSALDRLR
jgi:cytochrome c-type biogenesis protein CcmH